MDSLNLNTLPDRDAHTRQGMLPYLFALAHRYPELTPYSEADFGTRLWRPSAAQRATPPTRDEFQAALEEIFGEARKKRNGMFAFPPAICIFGLAAIPVPIIEWTYAAP